MNKEDWQWWRPRLFTLFVYTMVCAALCQTNSCNAEEQASQQASPENCGTISCGFAFYRWIIGILSDHEWAIVFWTAIISVIALAQLVMFYLQWRALRDTIRAAKESTQRQLRAYVNVSKPVLIGVYDDIAPSITLKLKNSGQTPATNVRVWCKIHLVDWPCSNEPDIQTTNEVEGSISILAPGQFHKIGDHYGKILSSGEVMCLRHLAHKRLLIKGRVEYIDIFGKHDWTTFKLWSWGASDAVNGKAPCRWAESGNDCDKN